MDFAWNERKREHEATSKKLNDAEQAYNKQQAQLVTATNNIQFLQNDLSGLKAQLEQMSTSLAQTVTRTEELMQFNNAFVVDLVNDVDILKAQMNELQANKRQRTEGGFGSTM